MNVFNFEEYTGKLFDIKNIYLTISNLNNMSQPHKM